MKTESELNKMILELTNTIKERSPELLKYVDEMPNTISSSDHPDITLNGLTTYYNSLVGLLANYEKNSPNHLPENANAYSPIAKTIRLDSANTNQKALAKTTEIDIAYNDEGEGKIPLIFLHGFPFDKSMWNKQMAGLKMNNRVIAIDIRGFGKSTDEDTTLNIDLFSDDLISFMDKLQLEKVIICGLSMGGYIALNAIKRFPERFEALVLCDTQCIADSIEAKEKRLKAIDQIKENGVTEFNEKFITNVFHPDSISTKTEVVRNLSDVVYANSKDIMMAGLTALAERSETCSCLSAIYIPTLIICGREDVVTPLAQSEFMHNNIQGSILKIINHAGHVSNLEQPDEFNKHLNDFCNSLRIVSN